MTQNRQQLLDVLRAAIAVVRGRVCVRRQLLDAPISGPVWLVAIGKAASPMALGVLDVLGSRVRRALVITKPEHDDPELRALPRVDLWEGGHPRPDANSLRAGAELLGFLRRAPDTAELVFCLSGGASSLVEVLPEGCTLEHLQGLNDWLLGSGLDIAAAEAGATMGWSAVEHAEFVAGDAAAAGKQIAEQLLAAAPGLHVWGGETTVQLPAQPGLGGRNQHLALAAAMRIAGPPGLLILAAGTDGTDGPGQDAGALVDGGSLARGESHGLDPARCLATADSGRFLEASGDLIHTGPTGTNVMDLILGLKHPRQTA